MPRCAFDAKSCNQENKVYKHQVSLSKTNENWWWEHNVLLLDLNTQTLKENDKNQGIALGM